MKQRFRGSLVPIKNRYKLLALDLAIDSKKDETETVHFTASASEATVGKPKVVTIAADAPEKVKRDVADEVQKLPRKMESSGELMHALREIYKRYQPKGLKKLGVKPGAEFEIFAEASARAFAEHLIGENGAGGCSVLIQIDGRVQLDDGVAFTLWNAGKGRQHAEARARTALLELADKGAINRATSLVEVFIRFSPCQDRCAVILEKIEEDMRKHRNVSPDLIRFKWYFKEYWKSRDVADAVIANYQSRGIFLMQIDEAILKEEISG
jgi:hypothetical protein